MAHLVTKPHRTLKFERVACRLHGDKAHDLRPALHEGVVGERLGSALLPLADGVKPVGELAGYFGLASELTDQLSRRTLAASLQDTDQLVHNLPRRDALVDGRLPVRRQLPG